MYSNYLSCQKILDGIQSIDYFLAQQLTDSVLSDVSIEACDKELLFHCVMACSEALREGHTCLKLSEISDVTRWQNNEDNKGGYHFPEISVMEHCFNHMNISPDAPHPLVYEFSRLYLRRYWSFENELSYAVKQLISKTESIDPDKGRAIIDQLFPDTNNTAEIDWQKVAVANAIGRQFTIIAGGPGTGKTFTVTKLLAALQALADKPLNIAMVAPTGKAAQRLNESIQKAKSFLLAKNIIAHEILNHIPDTASTLHRLLGVKMGSHNFRYNENRTLPYDVVLVDEISMIDLPLMSRLLRAINTNCRIIMLGDADQLPSVSAGSVLADLAPVKVQGYSANNSQLLKQLTGFTLPVIDTAYDHLTVLNKSHRFDGGGEIGLLARQVIEGQSSSSWDFLVRGQMQIHLAEEMSFELWIEQMVEHYYVPLFDNNEGKQLTIEQAFEQLNLFRFLAATRLGRQGVQSLNETIEVYLRNRGLISSRNEFYPGRPIMVTENNYHAGLYNGDIGLVWQNEEGRLQAAFPLGSQSSDSAAAIKWISIGRLPAIETVYAMTIHKTQGSEFTHVALVLPEQDSPILSRELLYTGITRASEKLTVWSDKSIWLLGVNRKVQRYSGLQQRVFVKPIEK